MRVFRTIPRRLTGILIVSNGRLKSACQAVARQAATRLLPAADGCRETPRLATGCSERNVPLPSIFMAEPDEKLLRREEVASILGVHPATVDRMVKRGDLPVVRWGQTVRFRRRDVDDFVDAHLERAERPQ